MNDLDFLELQDDPEFTELKDKLQDGLSDDWINVPVGTISKYLAYNLLEELEEINRIAKKDNGLTKDEIIDRVILRSVNQLTPERNREQESNQEII